MPHPRSDQLVMIADLSVRPDRLDAFLDYTAANLAISRGYPGNIAFDILVDEAEPGRVVFYEVWDAPESQRAYMAWRTEAGDLATLLGFLAGAPRFTALRRLIPT